MHSQAQNDDLVMSLVERALASPPNDLDRYLQETCADDTELMEQVRTYVAWEQRMGGFLTEPLYPRGFFEHPFEPGQLLQERFRIVRELARGGMGIVYEAVDEKLKRRIAIKCSKAGYGKRLQPEVRHASDISHPNICKIFEIHTASTEHGLFEFMTMEFLDGQTLTERLRRGFLSHKEALPIALQLCAGLAEAHRKQVIHGDLKSSNIVLTTDGGTVRTVITDFGLARRPDLSAQNETSGEVAGTPDYMAPELWRGGTVSVASDIYAVGVILREMVCGQEPNARWNRVVNRCLAFDPADRYQRVEDIAHALAPASRRLFLTSAIAAGLAVASGLATYKATTAPAQDVRLSVLQLESVPGPLSRAIGAQFARIKGGSRTNWSLVPATEASRRGVNSVDEAHTILGATHVLHGNIARETDASWLVNVYLIDAQSKSKREFKARYGTKETRYIPVALAAMVTGALHLSPVAGTVDVNDAARPYYRSGLLAMRRESRTDAAVDAMQRAVNADPDSPLTHAGQAEAWWWKYFATKDPKYLSLSEQALAEAQRRNGDLAPVHRISGILFNNRQMSSQALEAFLRTVELDPENSDGHRRLAIAYGAAGQVDKAVAEYRRAIALDPAYHRNHQSFGAFYFHRGEYPEALKHFQKAVELAPQEAATHYALATAFTEMGQFSAAEAELRNALLLGESPVILNNLGVNLLYQRREQEAIPYLMRALEKYPERYLWWMNLGTAYRKLNLLKDAEQANLRALGAAEAELMSNPRRHVVRAAIAYLRASLGDRERALFEVTQALSFASDDPATRWMAVLTLDTLGQREEALNLLKTETYPILADMSRSPELSHLSHDPRFQSLLLSKKTNTETQ